MNKLVAFLILCCSLATVAQESLQTQYLNSEILKEKEVFISKDIFDNTFTQEENILRKRSKYSAEHFSLPKLGTLKMVDLTHAQFPVLFYSDFNSIVLLSKELALLNTLDLTGRFSAMDPAYVGTSTQKNLWIVNQANQSVLRYNLSTLEVRNIYTIKEDQIKTYQSTLNYLYRVTATNQIIGIDIYGNEVLNYTLPSAYDHIQIVNNKQVFYSHQNKLYYVDMEKNKVFEIITDVKSILGFFYNTQKLSIFAEQKINNYQIKLP
ncbi:hypothetical protein [Myroides fluvii]|uniref:hypothetical protein n=1 Tax=Myroides fluvii TaxID=2572594 RepID=UPI00131D7486|nr:hypothetical protein [Myroides fluvii]